MTASWIKLAVSLGCLAALLWWTEATGVWTRLKGTEPTWIGLALLAMTAATLSMTRRWQLVARALGMRISYSLALREYYLAQLVNSALPGGVAGDAARAVRMRHEADLKRAAQSVVIERLLGQIAMFGLVFAGFVIALTVPGGLDWPAASWALPIGLASFALVAIYASRRAGASGRFVQMILRLQRQPEMLVHAAVTTGCLIFGFYACARATGTLIPAEAWATLIPLILSAMLIPLSVGGWGWREGAAAALFPLIGASASAGIAAGIAYGAVVMIAALPAGLVLFARRAREIIPTTGKSHST